MSGFINYYLIYFINNMNQTFSLSRWLLLMRRHWMENGTLYLYGILTIIGAIGISLFFWVQSNHDYRQTDLFVMYMFGLYVVGAIFASGSFDVLQKKEKGVYYLTLPASHFEKLLTLIVYNTLLFTFIFSLCFYGMQWLTVLIVKAKAAAHPDQFHYTAAKFGQNVWLDQALGYFAILFFGVQALFLLGSVYFKRFSFLLTLIALAIFFCLGIYYFNNLQGAFFPNHFWSASGLYPRYGGDKVYRMPESVRFVLKWICLLGWAPLFWSAAWFRLREKEI